MIVRQPKTGFRAGLDSVMLAAAVPARAGDSVLDLGAGVGTASLCLAARVRGCRITGVEIGAALAALADANAAANGMDIRVVCADVLALPKSLRGSFDHVFCNPPFYGEDGMRSPDAARERAKRGALRGWLEVGLKRTVSNGSFTAILPPERLPEALEVLPGVGVTVFALWPKAGAAAKRVIVQVRKGARAPLVLAAGLVLHNADGSPTPDAGAILRGGAALGMKGRKP